MQGANPCPIINYEVIAWNSANMESIVCAPHAPIRKSVMSAVTVLESKSKYTIFGLARNTSARKSCGTKHEVRA